MADNNLKLNCSFAVDNKTGHSIVPQECLRAAQSELAGWASSMLMFGVQKLVVKISSNASMIIPEFAMQLLPDMVVPPQLSRICAIYMRTIMSNMLLLGVLEITIEPTAERLEQQRRVWEQIVAPATPGQPVFQPLAGAAALPQSKPQLPTIVPKVTIKGGPKAKAKA